MKLEDPLVFESFLNRPDQRVSGLNDREGDASNFGPREFDVIGQVKADGLCFFLARADELAREMYLAHTLTVRRASLSDRRSLTGRTNT